jgi:hypothetical protein
MVTNSHRCFRDCSWCDDYVGPMPIPEFDTFQQSDFRWYKHGRTEHKMYTPEHIFARVWHMAVIAGAWWKDEQYQAWLLSVAPILQVRKPGTALDLRVLEYHLGRVNKLAPCNVYSLGDHPDRAERPNMRDEESTYVSLEAPTINGVLLPRYIEYHLPIYMAEIALSTMRDMIYKLDDPMHLYHRSFLVQVGGLACRYMERW